MPSLALAPLVNPAAFLLVVALFLYERYAPAVPREPDVARLGRNIGFLACNVVLSLAVVVSLTQGLADYPDLEHEDTEEALRYAAAAVAAAVDERQLPQVVPV